MSLKKILVILFIISLTARLYFLFFGIQTLSHDEIDFYQSGYVLANTGADQYGNKIFLTTGYISAIPSVPVYVSALFWKLIPVKSVIAARLPFTLINSFTPVLFFLIIYLLSGNLFLSLLAFIIFNFSPWFLHNSVTAAFDAPLALLFSLSSTLLLLRRKAFKLVHIVLYILLSFLAFNSYMGYKVVFPFFVFWQLCLREMYIRKNTKILIKKIIYFTGIAIGFFIFFYGLIQILPNNRLFNARATNEIVFLNKDEMANKIWYAQLTTQGSNFAKRIFANKLLTPLSDFFSKYLYTFNPIPYFLNADNGGLSGLFYFVDFFVLLVGLFTFQKILNKKVLFVLFIFFFGGMPFALSMLTVTIGLRGLLLILPYSLLIATGYLYMYRTHNFMRLIVLGIIILNILSGLSLYQYRVKVISSEGWYGTDTALVKMILTNKKPTVVFTNDPKGLFMQYAFYNSDMKQISSLSKELLKKNAPQYTNNTVTFIKGCKNLVREYQQQKLVIVEPEPCIYQLKKLSDFKVISVYSSLNMDGKIRYEVIKNE